MTTEIAHRIEPSNTVEARAPITPMEMIERAVSGGASIEALEKLMALQERWEANQGRKAFDAAIAEAKAEIPAISKNRTVDFTTAKGRTNYQYEDMAGIAKVVDPILSAHGLSYRYRTAQDGQTVTVTCILSHRDGYSEETTLSAAADQSGNKNHIQAVGSAATYLQRYTLKMALGLAASADDDGKGAAEAPQPANREAVAKLVERLKRHPESVANWLCDRFGIDTIADVSAAQLREANVMLSKREEAMDGEKKGGAA